MALLIGSIELVSILHDDLDWVDPITSWISGIDLNNAGLAIVALFAVTWIGAVGYWKLAERRSSLPACRADRINERPANAQRWPAFRVNYGVVVPVVLPAA